MATRIWSNTNGWSWVSSDRLCPAFNPCGTWLLYVCDMTHLRVWYDSFMRDTICVLLIPVGHDSFVCVTWLIHMFHELKRRTKPVTQHSCVTSRTFEQNMAHIRMSHGTSKWVMSHMNELQADTRTTFVSRASRHTHIRTKHGTHMNKLYTVSQSTSTRHVTNWTNESWHMYEGVIWGGFD